MSNGERKRPEQPGGPVQHLAGQTVRCPHCGENNVATDVRCWACDDELYPPEDAGPEAEQEAEVEKRQGPSWEILYVPGCVVPGIVASIVMLVLAGLLFADVASGHWLFGRRELAMAVVLVVAAVATLISVFKKDLWS